MGSNLHIPNGVQQTRPRTWLHWSQNMESDRLSSNNRGTQAELTETMRKSLEDHATMVAHAKRTAELYAKRMSVAEFSLPSLPAGRRLTHQYHPYRKATESSFLPPGMSQYMESVNNRLTETMRINLKDHATMLAHTKRTVESYAKRMSVSQRTMSSLPARRRSQSDNNRGRQDELTETMRRNLLDHETMLYHHAKRVAELSAKRMSAELLTMSSLPAGRRTTTENAAAAQVEILRPELVSHFRNLSLDHPTTSSAQVEIPHPEIVSRFCNLSLDHPTTSSSPDGTRAV